MTAQAAGITYLGLVARLKEHGQTIPNKPGARWHDIPCPICQAGDLLGAALRIQSRQGNAELGCRNGCDQLAVLRSLGYNPQQVDAPPTREGNEKHTGQLRMAYRLADTHKDRLKNVVGVGWHYWDSKRWARDDGDAKAKQAVYAVLRAALSESCGDTGVNEQLRKDVTRCESANGVDGILRLAAAMPEFTTTVQQLDADPYLLNTDNCTVDLRTSETREHNPADLITKVTRGAYDPSALAPVWTEFINKVLPDQEGREYLQRIAGMSLQGSVIEHILPVLIGTGANGKGVWYTAVMKAAGDYAAPAVPDLFEAREGAHPVGQMDLRGRRLVFVSELDEHRRLAEATTKRLTGGDTIKARYMHGNPIEFEPSHTAYLISNFLPKVSGDDPAIWRRIRVIPFEVTIPEEERDGHLGERLLLEADGILTWMLDGWKSYRRMGLNEPDSVKQATAGYQRDSDALARFLDDEDVITKAPAVKSTTDRLFNAWERWRMRDGAEQISLKKFGQALDKRGYPVTSKTRDGRWRDGICAKDQPPQE